MQELCGVDLIKQERDRQVSEEGWSFERDVAVNANGGLAWMACYYAMPGNIKLSGGIEIMPRLMFRQTGWHEQWAKRDKKDRIRQLVVAGALIAAEIDRIQFLLDDAGVIHE